MLLQTQQNSNTAGSHGLMNSLSSLRSSITQFANSGSVGRQQDAHEYLQSIFEKLNSCTTNNGNNNNTGKVQTVSNHIGTVNNVNRTKSGEGLADLLNGREPPLSLSRSSSMNLSASFKLTNGSGPFDGLIMNLVECLVCGYAGKLVGEPFNSLALSIGQQAQQQSDAEVDVLYMLRDYLKPEVLEGYKCVKCRVRATLASTEGVDHDVLVKLRTLNSHGRFEDEDFKKIFVNNVNIDKLLVGDVSKKLAHKRMFITRFPKIMCLVVERYYFNERGHMIKSDIGIDLANAREIFLSPMQFQVVAPQQNDSSAPPEELTPDVMAKLKEAFTRSQSQRNIVHKEYHYELECVVVHLGRTHEFGHFVAYRRSTNLTADHGLVETWYEISDDYVAPISFASLCQQCSKCVYMLFYQQVNT